MAQFDLPAVGDSSPVSSLISVDLPAPLTPTSATRSPRSMVKFTFVEHLLRAVTLERLFASTTVRPEGGGWGNLKWITGSSSGISMRSIFSSSLMRLCTCLALVAWARKRLMKASRCSIWLALVAIGRLQLRAPLVFLAEIFGVVALVDVQPLVPDLHGAVDGHIEKIAVVGDQNVTEGIVLQVVFEPVAGLQIEVIGRLIEQQQVRLGKQQFGQSDSHLPTSTELIRLASPSLPS